MKVQAVSLSNAAPHTCSQANKLSIDTNVVQPLLTAAMPITLYDNPVSIHAQYARAVLDETGIEYDKCYVDLPLGNLAPSYASVTPALSVPALSVTSGDANVTLTDSRDIINYCDRLGPGGSSSETLFPPDKRKQIDEVLDMVYSANGGQLSFEAQRWRNPLFDFAIGRVVGPYRSRRLRTHQESPAVASSPHLTKVYDAASQRAGTSNPPLSVLVERANVVTSFLHRSLEENGGPWLLGGGHTAADSVAAIWVQWIVWADVPSVVVSDRVLEFLDRARLRPAWEKMRPRWVISYVSRRLYAATALLGCVAVGGVWGVARVIQRRK